MRYRIMSAAIAAFGVLAVVSSVELAEVQGYKYHAIRRVFKSAGPDFQRRVAIAMSDGVIRRWEYDSLKRSSDLSSVGLDDSIHGISPAEDKVVLMAMAKQVDLQGGQK